MKTINSFLENSAKNYPDKVAIRFENNAYTFLNLQKKVDHIASFIISKTTKADRVAILLPNSIDFIAAYFAILQSNCVALLLMPNITDSNFLFQIENTSPRLIISQAKYLDKIKRCNILKNCEYADIDNLDYAKVSEKSSRKVQDEDVSSIIFTSGSTSLPKGVKLKHKNVVSATKNIIKVLNWKDKYVDLNISALTHSFGLGNIHCAFAVGATTVLFRDAINMKMITDNLISGKITTFGAVPTILKLLVDNYPEKLTQAGKHLRFIQTNQSSLDSELIKKILNLMPEVDFFYYYGLTEASRSTFINFKKYPNKIGSIGKPAPNVKIKIDPSTNEISIKGKHVIEEYWRNTEASSRIQDGWLKTSDSGTLDKDGFLYFQGRKDDIINVSGEKVSPEEVESIVNKIEGVIESAAVGVADKLLGEVVKVFVVTVDQQFDCNKVVIECRKKLESFKIPRHVVIIDKLPKTDNGKLRRNTLK